MAVERKFVEERVRKLRVKEWIVDEVRNAGFGGIDIVRTPLGTQVTLFVERPGLVIGRGGRRIRKLTEKLKEFGLDNPQVAVDEIEKPEFNAQLMASLLARALERGWYFRKAGYRFLYRIMESGAKGCEIEISGKLTSERARTEKFVAGTIVHTGEPAESMVNEGFDIAIKKLGVYGVRVRIIPPDVELPDEIHVKDVDLKKEEQVEQQVEQPQEQEQQEKEVKESEDAGDQGNE
ncbi:ribosomal protein S3, eukaryotic/archaeal type [Geoglobus ahangari]|uniref:Small ribosomal subunit protein uS3 n=1 Tax=Geoglobus ahangari TaxID=113653 RepID=A0A0F7IGB4_9EURY|nr:30S ribosomal protein S3 [Geoglobus ahangari]AKG92265.1 ribosomal protein S3, eukaryotic/archaeal type [Geoglobus ahangari]NOY11906.1 30S ribosomal protein S3 [Archaeoglobi archaeon]